MSQDVGARTGLPGKSCRSAAPVPTQPKSCEHAFVTSEGSAHGRFSRAIQQRNLWAAEMSLRELRTVSLADALGYLDLLAEQKPEKLERAAVRAGMVGSRRRRPSYRWQSRNLP
jgi:hypothetical protein